MENEAGLQAPSPIMLFVSVDVLFIFNVGDALEFPFENFTVIFVPVDKVNPETNPEISFLAVVAGVAHVINGKAIG